MNLNNVKLFKPLQKMEDFLEINYVEDSDTQSIVYQEKRSKKVTDNLLTPYEYAKILSRRATELRMGYEPAIEWNGSYDPIAIAKREIELRVVPLVVIRKIPNLKNSSGYKEEIWDLKNLDIRDS